jgi:hypothetical protein
MYRVYFTTTVDHPEKRDATFRPVPPGTKVAQVLEHRTQRAAVAEFEGFLRGEGDWSSEYVSRAAVYADNGLGGMRTVRREVRRERPLPVRLYPYPGSSWSEIRRIAPSATRCESIAARRTPAAA